MSVYLQLSFPQLYACRDSDVLAMKIQLAKLSRQLAALGRNGSSSAMVLKMTPMPWQLLQGLSCAFLPAAAPVQPTQKHAPRHSAFPGTRSSHGEWEMAPPSTRSGAIPLLGSPQSTAVSGGSLQGNPCSILLQHLVCQRFDLLAPLLQEGKKQSLLGEVIAFPSSHHGAAK